MAKVHLQANIAKNKAPKALCATEYAGNGRVKNNSRSTYRFMASEIVPFAEFKNVPAENRCAHCMDRGLIVRNRQRREKGMEPVNHLFD